MSKGQRGSDKEVSDEQTEVCYVVSDTADFREPLVGRTSNIPFLLSVNRELQFVAARPDWEQKLTAHPCLAKNSAHLNRSSQYPQENQST